MAAKPNVAYMRTLSAPGGHATTPRAAAVEQSQRKSLALSPFNGHAETSTAAATSATHKLTNFQSALKIEERTAATSEATTATTVDDLKSRRQRQFSGLDMETASMSMPKRVGINHAAAATSPTLTNRNAITPPPVKAGGATGAAATTAAASGTQLTSAKGAATPGYLVDVTKKGSTSTIWTSEESILRSVGAVDEDNK